MSSELMARVRGEFREMPGLRLTSAQACRLWQIDGATCDAILQTLLAQGFLGRTSNGMFMALPTPGLSTSVALKAAPAHNNALLVVSERRSA